MDTRNEDDIVEMLKSINNSIDDMKKNPIEVPSRLPSNFEIMLSGIAGEYGLNTLFSPKVDQAISMLFSYIENAEYDKIISNKDKMESVLDKAFGTGSFQGPVSKTILKSIEDAVQSKKYNEIKVGISKTMTNLKKILIVLKELNKNKSKFDKHSEEYKKYCDAIYAIKQVLKFVKKVYKYRSMVNKKVVAGLNNIIHEENDLIND